MMALACAALAHAKGGAQNNRLRRLLLKASYESCSIPLGGPCRGRAARPQPCCLRKPRQSGPRRALALGGCQLGGRNGSQPRACLGHMMALACAALARAKGGAQNNRLRRPLLKTSYESCSIPLGGPCHGRAARPQPCCLRKPRQSSPRRALALGGPVWRPGLVAHGGPAWWRMAGYLAMQLLGAPARKRPYQEKAAPVGNPGLWHWPGRRAAAA